MRSLLCVLATIILATGTLDSVSAQTVYNIHPRWSPDGTQLAYYRRVGDYANLIVMDAKTGRETAITSAPSYDGNPSWSPDGTRILFTRAEAGMGGSWDVWTINADGSAALRLMESPEREMHPSWSPNGPRITFIRSIADGTEVFVADADGSNVRQLTTTEAREFHAKWSSDGRFILADSSTDGSSSIVKIDAETGETLRLSAGEGRQPVAGPAGAVAFSRDSDIWVRVADGRERRVTTTPEVREGGLTWAPDGRLAFHAEMDGAYAIYMLEADGTGIHRLSLPEAEAPADC
ncbi:MAG: Tol biopolymer transport system component [Rhodothermales bacterium]|jgi:Tol biopolymer transport system component